MDSNTEVGPKANSNISSLFRPEALRRAPQLDAVLLRHDLRSWVVAGFAILVVVAIILFLALGTYTRRVKVAGQLVPRGGLVSVQAPATGSLTEVFVNEGDLVNRGDTLAKLAIRRPILDLGDSYNLIGASIKTRRESLERGLRMDREFLRSQESSLRRQLSLAKTEVLSTAEGNETKTRRLESSRDKLSRMQKLLADSFVSPDQIRQQENTVLNDTSEVRDGERDLAALTRQVEQLQLSLREIPGREAQLVADYERAMLDVGLTEITNDAQSEVRIVAPLSGVVTTRVANPGLAVSENSSLVTIVPLNHVLDAQMLIPSDAVGLIDIGQRVRVRYQAFPYQKFGQYEGTISAVSRSALTDNELRTLTGHSWEAARPMYKVTVVLRNQLVSAYGRAFPLRPGMQLEADILLERRRLVEWLFEPLYALTKRIAD